jgi:1-aminocyclopropane-1-carboxylate deaminase/D-cysteine desulfhydrase-like pyridoxal-dependent ACC family enzyme
MIYLIEVVMLSIGIIYEKSNHELEETMSAKIIFDQIKDMPRRRYINDITPLQKLTNLSKALGGEVEIYIKRDDLLPYGGNKIRKLELHEMALAQEMKKELEANGKSAYILARGGSCPLGNCGYILCADEILSQAKEINVAFDYVVCPSGTGGTQTGLLVGFEMANASISLLGINVSQSKML